VAERNPFERLFTMTPPHLPRSALRLSALALGLATAFASAAQGTPPPVDERAALTELRNTTLGLIDALVEQGLLTRAKADELVRRARSGAAAASAETAAPTWGQPARPVVRVPYLSETARAQIKEEVRNDVLATARDEGWTDGRKLPGWVRSIVVEGDLRIRAQGEAFDENNASADLFALQNITQESPAWAPDLTNTQHDRSRFTGRARIGLTAKMSDTTSAGVRLATGGSSGSPTSESQTLSGDFNRWGVGFDRAWLQWEPVQGDWLKGGRMAVPFDRGDLLWPDDLALDGVAGKAEWDFGPGLYGFAVGGAFPLEEFANSTHDKWLYGAQLGLDWASSGGDWQMRGALGIYNFDRLEGTRETDAPPVNQNVGVTPYLQGAYSASVRQKGNTLINLNAPICLTVPTTPGCASTATWGLASKFRPVDLKFGIVARRFRPYELALDVDVVHNTGFDRADIERRSGLTLTDLKEKTTGYQVRLGFGMPKVAEKGDWRGFVAYRHFERDAWVDAFTDSSWHGGGTNYKGFGVGAEYAYDHHATLGLRYFSTRELDDGVRYTDASGQVRGNMSSAPLRIDTVQLETNVRF
jgi:hypothetical protein